MSFPIEQVLRSSLLAIVMLSSAACAHASFNTRIEVFGEYVDTYEMEALAASMYWEDAEDVKVYIGEGPDGVEVDEGGISIDENQWEVVAKVSAEINKNNTGAAFMGFWLYDYAEDEEWKRGFCGWQIPFSWLTLGMWSMYMPTYWPCRLQETDSLEDVQARKTRMIKTLKKAVKAAGGDTLVITASATL